jgi:type II secretory pathway component PulC
MISGNDSSATIKFKGRPEQVFQQGDKLNSNLELIEIQPFRVIVTENGIKKQLMMKKPDVIIQSEPITTVRAESSSQGFALANMFGAVPVNIAGGKGFKINNLSSNVKALADIRDGDVVVQVDGLSVQDLMSNPMKMMTLSKANSVPVTVMRNGRQEIIYVNAASLSAKMLPTLGFNP